MHFIKIHFIYTQLLIVILIKTVKNKFNFLFIFTRIISKNYIIKTYLRVRYLNHLLCRIIILQSFTSSITEYLVVSTTSVLDLIKLIEYITNMEPFIIQHYFFIFLLSVIDCRHANLKITFSLML